MPHPKRTMKWTDKSKREREIERESWKVRVTQCREGKIIMVGLFPVTATAAATAFTEMPADGGPTPTPSNPARWQKSTLTRARARSCARTSAQLRLSVDWNGTRETCHRCRFPDWRPPDTKINPFESGEKSFYDEKTA